jgi:alanine racemase
MTSYSEERAWAKIDLAALKSNLSRVRQLSPKAGITAVIKANAYGHGMTEVANALSAGQSSVDCFAVASLQEAVELNLLGTSQRILLLPGFCDAKELEFLVESGIEFVIHADYQLALFKAALLNNKVSKPVSVWLKLNTGMNRLGMTVDEFKQAFAFLRASKQISNLVIMSHLAAADAPRDADSKELTDNQLTCFQRVVSDLQVADDDQVRMSLAASAGILAMPETHYHVVRPGIMLYGGSPLADKTGPELGLEPVMTLCSRLIAINEVPAGSTIGYGATYLCDRDTRVGVVSIGYGDGYPRAAPNGTPVLIKGQDGYRRSKLIGRVSMDMITIDLTDHSDAAVGDEVLLWGKDLPADDIAKLAGTISYELFCQITKRVHFVYS